MSDRDRARARQLAREARQVGKPAGWFEGFYAQAARGEVQVPWDDGVPNPTLLRWLDARGPVQAGTRALDMGCGYGDNALELARRGYSVTASDISPTALKRVEERRGDAKITTEVANALKPPVTWRERFDLVAEIYTLQVLPPPERARLASVLTSLLRPGGILLVVCRGREPSDPLGELPWPLTRREVEAIAQDDVELVEFEAFDDDEDPPQRRFLAEFRRT